MASKNVALAKEILKKSINSELEGKLYSLCMLKVEAHIKPIAFSYALCALKKTNLLTLANINSLEAYFNPQHISSALNAMGKLATQENLNTLLALKNFEFTEHSGYLFYRIPEKKFSQSVFDQIIEFSQTTDSIRQINRFIDQLLTKTISIDKRQSTLFLSSTTPDSGIINDHSQNKLTR
ncbi:hypothetical protein [Rickettsiella endosymbiont of Aleochara curtula]|uniref:hypothetical protein n=1 Tax=Rickettsiella endosymbiont of Aleochara curtula TaxID=3077936 RepID=UPI00313DA315